MPTMLRRAVLIAGCTVSLAASAKRSFAQVARVGSPVSIEGGPTFPFSLPALPYAVSANEPYIDAQTMELHHDKHHAAYVANLNAAVKDHSQVATMPLPAMLARLDQLPESIRTTVRNNGGGHANHSMFWQIMGGKGGDPNGELAVAINRDFGSIAKLRENFNKAAAGVFGSGWAMVTVDRTGKLTLVVRANQDSPLMEGKVPLFGNDVWEHAYYLKYQNRRPDYLAAWWNVVDWSKISERYHGATAGTLAI
jgi:Fe-Mn family superoxide dismutase